MTKDQLVEYFSLFSFGTKPSIGTWLSQTMHEVVANRLAALPKESLSKVQFNQLLVVSQVASVSDGFFRYYWRMVPTHPYDVMKIEGYNPEWTKKGEQEIQTIEQLRWGLYRLYVDGLLYFGNVRAAFSSLRSRTYEEIRDFFYAKRFSTEAIAQRGPSLPMNDISKDDRYLISEMVCKTFGELPAENAAARKLLQDAWSQHKKAEGGAIKFHDFLKKYVINSENERQLLLSYDEFADVSIDSAISLEDKFNRITNKFLAAREKAIKNTYLYLSMVNDLDVYVATSMRNRANFRDMANACELIFGDKSLSRLHLRYFDPTMSAARGHEDKGLIECLMVKCAKILVYCEGEGESYGKDAEAAMALSLGKPVIFYCDYGKRTRFYKETHPLARLIDFRTGVAVGAIVTDKVEEVTELLLRIFENRMEYKIEHHKDRPGFLKLVEKLSESVVRLQSDDQLIGETFWNNYHNHSRRMFQSLAAGKETERLRE